MGLSNYSLTVLKAAVISGHKNASLHIKKSLQNYFTTQIIKHIKILNTLKNKR